MFLASSKGNEGKSDANSFAPKAAVGVVAAAVRAVKGDRNGTPPSAFMFDLIEPLD